MNYCTNCNDNRPLYAERRKLIARYLLIRLLIMKLILLITAFTFQVSAAVLGQQVTLNVKNASLKEVMRDVRKQSGYYFFFESDYLKNAKPVTVYLDKTPIDKALQTIFKDQPFEYAIDGKMITLRPKEKAVQEQMKSFFSAITIRGKVVDENGKPLPGASVKAGGKVAVTNADGEFAIEGVEDNVTVEASYIGYVSAKIIGSPQFITITLQSTAANLQEVVVNKGYYTIKRELNTGSVGTISAKEISDQPISNPINALQGRITGLYISEPTGIVGAAPNVRLRGRNSVSNGVDPLYIIDGIPFDSKSLSQLSNAIGTGALSPFMNIRPGDIDRIDVLKDADATAIYGSRGANGVILITTKKGKAGKTSVNFDVYRGAAVVASKLKLLNTPQYLQVRKEANYNDNVNPLPNEYDIDGTWDTTRYTDWQDLLIGNTAHSTDVKASVNGGTELTRFLVGFGYRKEGLVFPGDFNNQIGSGNVNINHNSQDEKFKMNLGANYSTVDSKLPTTNFADYILLPPNTPEVYKPDGQINWESNTFDNPLALLLRTSNAVTKNLLTNLSINYTLFKGFSLAAKLGYNNMNINEENRIPYSSYMPMPGDDQAAMRSKTIGFNQVTSYIIEPQINYNIDIKSHHFEALAGVTFNDRNNQRTVENTSGYGNDHQIRNSFSATTTRNSNANTQYKYNAFYFRLGYNFSERYIINLTGRRDGSSRFGPGKQFGNFGALGAAWNFAKEPFAKSLPFLSLGKLRGSIGTTGNDQFTDYEFISAYSNGTQYYGVSNLNPSRLTNPDFRWETINKIEGGIELGFFNDRVLVNASYFRNRTSNQLVGLPLPRTTGFDVVRANLPATVENKGFEFEVQANNIINGALQWDASFNISVPKNKLVSYPNIEKSSNNLFYAVGYPLSVAFVYHYTGIDADLGQYTFEDRDKSGTVDQRDRYPRFVGQHFFGGLNNSLRFRNFNLDIFCQFVKQTRYKYHSNQVAGARYFNFQTNQPIAVLQRWQQKGDEKPFQKFVSVQNTTGAFLAGEQFLNSDAMLVDGSFLRLKNVSLSYNIPENILRFFKISGFRAYVQGQNIFTITGFEEADPENSSGSGLTPPVAPLRTVAVGLQLTL